MFEYGILQIGFEGCHNMQDKMKGFSLMDFGKFTPTDIQFITIGLLSNAGLGGKPRSSENDKILVDYLNTMPKEEVELKILTLASALGWDWEAFHRKETFYYGERVEVMYWFKRKTN